MKKVLRFFVSSGATVFRLFFIGGAVVVLLIMYIDDFTNSRYGTNNLVLISASFAFFPLFFALFFEFLLRGYRKEKRIKKQVKEKLLNQKG